MEVRGDPNVAVSIGRKHSVTTRTGSAKTNGRRSLRTSISCWHTDPRTASVTTIPRPEIRWGVLLSSMKSSHVFDLGFICLDTCMAVTVPVCTRVKTTLFSKVTIVSHRRTTFFSPISPFIREGDLLNLLSSIIFIEKQSNEKSDFVFFNLHHCWSSHR